MKNTTNILNKYVILEATQEDVNTCIRHIKADKKELNFNNLFEYLNYYVFELGFLNNYKEKHFRIKNIYDVTLDTLENLNIKFDPWECFEDSYSIIENRFKSCKAFQSSEKGYFKIIDNSINDLLISVID